MLRAPNNLIQLDMQCDRVSIIGRLVLRVALVPGLVFLTAFAGSMYSCMYLYIGSFMSVSEQHPWEEED